MPDTVIKPPEIQLNEISGVTSVDRDHKLVYDRFQQVRGGTLLALVERLSSTDIPPDGFEDTFLLTYPSFTTARDLFNSLRKRFQIQPPQEMMGETLVLWRQQNQIPICVRVVQVLISWLTNYWMEKQSIATSELLRNMLVFVEVVSINSEIPSAPLSLIISDRLLEQQTVQIKQAYPHSVSIKISKKLDCLFKYPVEIAYQLTLIESKLYNAITPLECLSKSWQEEKVALNDEEAPLNIKACINHSNRLGNWIAHSILSQTDIKERVAIITQFIAIADKCRTLNNYSTLVSIVSTLYSPPIRRMSSTLDQVHARTRAILDSLCRLIGPARGFQDYRESIRNANLPCIPFLGILLTDLSFIEDGMRPFLKDNLVEKKDAPLISFAKATKYAHVIREIRRYQSVAYDLKPDTKIQEWILESLHDAGNLDHVGLRQRNLETEMRQEDREAEEIRKRCCFPIFARLNSMGK